MPAEMLQKKRNRSRPESKQGEKLTEKQLEEQKQQVLTDLNLSLHGPAHEIGCEYVYFARVIINVYSAENKTELAKSLVTNL